MNVDATGDIILPGAFQDGLAKFLSDGFIGGINHDWDAPIGHPVEAREVPGGLYFKAVLDDTPDAQSLRAKMKVNPASGRATIRKLSIGYRTLAGERLGDEAAVKSLWQAHGYTPSADDEVAVKALYTRRRGADGKEFAPGVRVLRKVSTFEISPVAVPANDKAAITGAKFYGGMDMPMPASPSRPDPDSLLGDTDRVVAWAAMSKLHDMLCMALYGILGNEMVPVAARIAMVGEAIDQFKASLVPTLTYFLAGPGSDAASEGGAEPASIPAASGAVETMARQFKARFGLEHDHESFSGALAAATAPGFAEQSRLVVSAVGGFADRARARVEARLKDGRELSAANRAALSGMRDGLMAHASTIDDMLARTERKPAKGLGAGEAGDVVPPVPESTPAARPEGEAKAGPAPVDPARARALYHQYLIEHEAPRWGVEDTTTADVGGN